jgi:hypothetical protein
MNPGGKSFNPKSKIVNLKSARSSRNAGRRLGEEIFILAEVCREGDLRFAAALRYRKILPHLHCGSLAKILALPPTGKQKIGNN